MTVPTEHEEQRALMTWAAAQAVRYPELHLLHAIPNGGHRSKATAGKLKAEGVKPGVPDLHLPVPRGSHRSLYLEMKRQKGGKLSEAQRWWHEALTAQGHHVQRVDGFEQARTHLLAYLAQPPPPDLKPFVWTSPVAEKSAAPKRISKARITDHRPPPLLYPGKH